MFNSEKDIFGHDFGNDHRLETYDLYPSSQQVLPKKETNKHMVWLFKERVT